METRILSTFLNNILDIPLRVKHLNSISGEMERIGKKIRISIQSFEALFFPAGKIAEKAMWRSVFLTIWHRILNADSTKTPSSSVTF